MIYFIPAWYNKNELRENEQIWYYGRKQTEIDDTVKQIQLFHRNHAYPYKIMLMGYTPNLRHFLHRQSIYHAPYWSCFDAIQGIRRKKAAVLSFHSLNWPKDTEFIYTPFAVIATLHGEKYAQIDFGEDGNPIQIDMYKHGVISRRNYYDDRGFIGSTVVYENGNVLYEQFLDEKGVWKICKFADGHVIVNPKSNYYLIQTDDHEEQIRYAKESYENISYVIREVFETYLKQTHLEDIFCIAMHDHHTAILNSALNGRKTILSFFGDRMAVVNNNAANKLLSKADYIVSDTKDVMEKIIKESGRTFEHITSITPYDSRVDFGISLQLHEQRILIPVDDVAEHKFEKIIVKVSEYMQTNDNAIVHLFTRKSEYNRKNTLLEKTSAILEKNNLEPAWARAENTNKFEFMLDEEEFVPIRFYVDQCIDELSVSKCLRSQRLMIDMGQVPDLFLQIACISMGIPQIVSSQTEYIEDGKNGIINKNINKLDKNLAFYLDGLSNWNEAMIHSYELSKKYTTEKLVEQWLEVIDIIEKGN